ncbi:thiamine pyrophosphate-dependent dehydrogenase E1 component subunit alpha [Amycolatopsis taiwanensis]|uniref:Acetoin dehydrogenase n=1 Tax=Amycolatopsis taiwanensis TaxID=342230 RepID=A0A9W6R491_9PSEU|nr:thiamine pyrophosphate-dependent dehydrogenase E1 component subunit alpha [Amycolatopsis taiwanensis]GLY68973.1 acetoin dehydrogenase [Amycolatopsis taiwanensis]
MSDLPAEIDPDVDLVRAMVRIRRIEETLADHYRDEQQMRTPTHFSIGQEATPVGMCAAAEPDDVVYAGHRSHAPYLAKGGDLPEMVAELHGKEAGCARGRGGSVHLIDPAANFAGSAAILGEMISVATGAALAFHVTGRTTVALTFFGDGATEEGVFAESLNLAALHRLPVVFVCENNGYSVASPLRQRQPGGTSITARAAAHGVHALEVDGNDVFAIRDVGRAAVARARAGGGPVFVESHTYRWREHVGPGWGYDHGQRTRAEVDSWIARCPIRRAVETLRGVEPRIDDWVRGWEAEYTAEIQQAIRRAKAAPWPGVSELTRGTYGAAPDPRTEEAHAHADVLAGDQ